MASMADKKYIYNITMNPVLDLDTGKGKVIPRRLKVAIN
jgi:hypothetical protein